MHAGNGDVGPYDAVAAEDHTWVRDAVATRGHPLSENSPEFAKPARYALVAMSKMDLASIVSKVAKFGPRSEVRTLSEDGIADVVEVRRFRSGKKNGVLDLGRMTDHGVGTNPGVLPHIGPATYNRSGADVARPDEVGSSFYRGRFIDDDAVSTRKNPGFGQAMVPSRAAICAFRPSEWFGSSMAQTGPLVGNVGTAPSSSPENDGKRAVALARSPQSMHRPNGLWASMW